MSSTHQSSEAGHQSQEGWAAVWISSVSKTLLNLTFAMFAVVATWMMVTAHYRNEDIIFGPIKITAHRTLPPETAKAIQKAADELAEMAKEANERIAKLNPEIDAAARDARNLYSIHQPEATAAGAQADTKRKEVGDLQERAVKAAAAIAGLNALANTPPAAQIANVSPSS